MGANLTLQGVELFPCFCQDMHLGTYAAQSASIFGLSLFEPPIKDFPVLLHNLIGLQELQMSCDFVQLSSTILMPELSDFRFIKARDGNG